MKLSVHASCFLILVASVSCDNESAPKELGPFQTINSNGGVKFNLVQGAVTNKVVSTTLNESLYNVSNGQLSVNATGGSMTIAVSNLKLLWCNACHVESSGPLVADTLNFYVHAGGMELSDVHVNKVLGISAVNTGTFELSGTATFLDLSMVNSINFKGYNLITDSTHINSGNALTSEVYATQVLDVTISSSGDVHYKGNPPLVRTAYTGAGRAIPK